jgi:hypothetical protein
MRQSPQVRVHRRRVQLQVQAQGQPQRAHQNSASEGAQRHHLLGVPIQLSRHVTPVDVIVRRREEL